VTKRKLIEVSLPLEQINKQAAREKSIRHGHPSTLHLWWARRPLAAARAVLFSQLVDDPSSYADDYREEGVSQGLDSEALDRFVEKRITSERARLHNLLALIVDWDNLDDEGLMQRARNEILRSTDGSPPPILDPFAGGGAIPLEAQRLGLEAHASDLNPVAVLINKALIEIPPKFAGRPPVSPDADRRLGEWPRATGLAEDVRRYGAWMRDEAERRIGHLYPKATLPSGEKADVIAWIWARTVTCPNPACGLSVPLVRTWWLSKTKGKEAYVQPEVRGDRVLFTIGHDSRNAPKKDDDGTMTGRGNAVCVACLSVVAKEHVKEQGVAGGLGVTLMGIVAQGKERRIYLAPTPEHVLAADVLMPADVPQAAIAQDPRNFWTPLYGLTDFKDLFTHRQLVALTTFGDLVAEARERVLVDALARVGGQGARLEAGGDGAAAYADSVATYLGLAVSKITNTNSTITSWMSDRGAFRETFARQALPMVWDFAEANPLGPSGGSFVAALDKGAQVVLDLPMGSSQVTMADAATAEYSGVVLATDPPYYDNIGYSDLSDFFYVWLRRSLRSVHPVLLGTMLVPKTEELVANPYRNGGKEGARDFFEQGFQQVFARARARASADYPITVFYAFKQAETDLAGTASTGWETLLEGMIRNGWTVTATWPMRTEGAGRIIARGTNALASSIVLALRPRVVDAPVTDRRGYIEQLREELPAKLRELQQGAIAPVDLAQAAIGPGIGVFSRYSRVVEPDGSVLSVREALRLINTVLAEVLSEQEGDFDTDTRWCLKWFETHGFGTVDYGEAETLASAYNTSVKGLDRSSAVRAAGGEVRLLHPDQLEPGYRPETDDHITLWEVALHIATALDRTGLDEAGRILLGAGDRVDTEALKELAYLLFSLCERRGMTQEAILFNALVTSWPEVVAAAKARAGRTAGVVQAGFDFDDDLTS
jgi:putative DNA methylase